MLDSDTPVELAVGFAAGTHAKPRMLDPYVQSFLHCTRHVFASLLWCPHLQHLRMQKHKHDSIEKTTCAPDMPDLSAVICCGLCDSLLNSSGALCGWLKSRYSRSWATSKEASPPWTMKACGVAGVCASLGRGSSACRTAPFHALVRL